HISKLADGRVCPVCGGELYQRNDDKPETISTRLKAYHEQTEPLIGYYKGLGTLRPVNGDSQLEEVFKAILATLE
ncbi:MAG: adenylate kinase, partial [Oscillospiraceae bacterium]|nr:adenylate kinase [Oscillospiraceae bacterium]